MNSSRFSQTKSWNYFYNCWHSMIKVTHAKMQHKNIFRPLKNKKINFWNLQKFFRKFITDKFHPQCQHLGVKFARSMIGRRGSEIRVLLKFPLPRPSHFALASMSHCRLRRTWQIRWVVPQQGNQWFPNKVCFKFETGYKKKTTFVFEEDLEGSHIHW